MEPSVGWGPNTPRERQLIELVAGREYLIFLADAPDDLPSDAVQRELRVAARRARVIDRRGDPTGFVADVVAGLIGNVGADAIAATMLATIAYVKRVRPKPPIEDVNLVHARLRTVYEERGGDGEFSEVSIRQQADGSWRARFMVGDVEVKARLNASCTIVAWDETRER